MGTSIVNILEHDAHNVKALLYIKKVIFCEQNKHKLYKNIACVIPYLKNFIVFVSQSIKLGVCLIKKFHNFHGLAALITIICKIHDTTEHDCDKLVLLGHDRSF